MSSMTGMTYAERLQTFEGHWNEDMTAARQLAAIGHICDRLPLEALDEGSHCLSCSMFVTRNLSVRAFGDATSASRSYEGDFASFDFHHSSCERLQVRIPLNPQAVLGGLHGSRVENLCQRFDKAASGSNKVAEGKRLSQNSSLFSLPTEIRLQIYKYILPSLEPVTQIQTLHQDSARVITQAGYTKIGKRNTTQKNILRTCRNVHDEAIDLLYASTTFQFASTKVMYLFLRSIGKAGRSLITSVDITCGQREDAIAFALLASCEDLRAITLRLGRPIVLFQRAPIWIFDGMSCLLYLSGLEEVEFGPISTGVVYLSDRHLDAAVLREQLTRPKGAPGDIKGLSCYSESQTPQGQPSRQQSSKK